MVFDLSSKVVGTRIDETTGALDFRPATRIGRVRG
jgi:hypothetical protein